MSHQINYDELTGKHAFMSVREKAWHGLGQIITDYPTSGEAIKYAGLDYVVEKRPIFTYDIDNQEGNPETDLLIPEISVPDYYATVRKDTDQVLGVVGKDYQIVQNVDAFNFFDEITGNKDGICYETAGALGKGERIFITAKLPDYIKVGKDDLIEQYLFLTTSHDGFGSIMAAFTPVRVVCQNTLNAALHNRSNSIKIRHTASANDRLKEAHKLLGITNRLAAELEQVFNYWSKISITDREVKRLVQLAMSPNKEVWENLKNGKEYKLSSAFNNIVNNVMEYSLTSPTQQEATTKGTLFGAYNAVTGYFQNVSNYKDNECKLKSILFGTGQRRGQTAFDLCQAFASKGFEGLN